MRELQIGERDDMGTGEKSIRVLVVDDSPVSRKLVEHSLAQTSCEVVFAKDGSDALRVFASSGSGHRRLGVAGYFRTRDVPCGAEQIRSLVISHVEKNNIHIVTERLREKLSACEFSFSRASAPLIASFGVAARKGMSRLGCQIC